MFTGSYTALVTPFKNDKIDFDSYEKLIEFQIENGITGIVTCGSTGEAVSLDENEQIECFKFTVEKAKGRVKVIAGTGTNNTKKVLRLTKAAKEAKIDGALIVTPYYNKPTQKGLFEHFKLIANEVDIPIILYNVPGRTACNLLPETVLKLSEIKNIVSVKEASGNLSQMQEICKHAPKDFTLLSGDDGLTLPIMSIGGKGVISVTSNILPKLISELVNDYLSGNYENALSKDRYLSDIHKAMFIETNPIPVKKALSYMNFCSSELRLPLSEIEDTSANKLKAEMMKYSEFKAYL